MENLKSMSLKSSGKTHFLDSELKLLLKKERKSMQLSVL